MIAECQSIWNELSGTQLTIISVVAMILIAVILIVLGLIYR